MSTGDIVLLQDFLLRAASEAPRKEAVVTSATRATFGGLVRDASALAHALVRRGVSRGDRVVVFDDNGLETLVAFWGALLANGVPSVVSPQTKADKLAYILGDCTPKALVAGAHLAHSFEAPFASSKVGALLVAGDDDAAKAIAASTPRASTLADAIGAESGASAPARRSLDVDLASIIYTSGSTGRPKGVMLTHRNMITAATSIGTYLGLGVDDVVASCLPLSFDYGLYQSILAARSGAKLVLEKSFAYPAQVLRKIEGERATVFPGVPTMFAVLGELRDLGATHDLSSIRVVTNTAAALPTKHIGLLRRIFPSARIFSMYGLTECKRVSYLPPEDLDRKPTSVGVPIPNTEVWIEDEDGNRLGPGQVGQLVVRGATVMAGYWGDPEATAKKLRPGPVPGERVLHTGDYCSLDDEGYLTFVARMDDVIKSRGEKVPPKEVENAIVEVPGVKECAVVGVPDEILGQAIKAIVVVERGAEVSEDDVRRACRARLEPFMVPHRIVFADDLPKTTTGKIRKTTLG